MKRHRQYKKRINKILLIVLIITATILCSGIVLWFKFDPVHSPVNPETKTEIVEPAPVVIPVFDKTKHSTTDPNSVWVIANKQHPLNPIDFEPANLITSPSGAVVQDVVSNDLESMLSAALADGVNITIVSSYRSYYTQSYVYGNYVAQNGQELTDTFSARPGFSEHQTGLAIDFGSSTNSSCNFDVCYMTATEGAWLAANASNYGFLLRYTEEKQYLTGYKAEPWHYRYVGRELMDEMKKQGIVTLEEFFNVDGGEVYL